MQPPPISSQQEVSRWLVFEGGWQQPRTCIVGIRIHLLRSVFQLSCLVPELSKNWRAVLWETYGPWMRNRCCLWHSFDLLWPQVYCKCSAVPNKASLKTGSSSSAAVQLCFSARRGLHVSRCLKMSKETGRSDWKKHCITNQVTLWYMLLISCGLNFSILQDKKGFNMNIPSPESDVYKDSVGLGNLTRPFS